MGFFLLNVMGKNIVMKAVNRQDLVIQRSPGAATMGWASALLWFVLKDLMALRDNFKVPHIPVLWGGGMDQTLPLFEGRGRRDRFEWLSPGCLALPGSRPWSQVGFEWWLPAFCCALLLKGLALDTNRRQGKHLALRFVSKFIKAEI